MAEKTKKGVNIWKGPSFYKEVKDTDYSDSPCPPLRRFLARHVAPLSLPLHRRLETGAVFFWISTFLFMGSITFSFLLYLLFYTRFWWVTVAYFCFYLYDLPVCDKGGRRTQWMRQWSLWRHFANYFPVTVIKTAELPPDRNYIMGYHPHGILCSGAAAFFCTEGTNREQLFPGLTPYMLTLEALFKLPLYRELFLCAGSVSGTKKSIDYILNMKGAGRALGLVIGGAPESLDCHAHKLVLHLNKRVGFCKIALRNGTSLVPIFSFGENDLYNQVSNEPGSILRRFQNFLQATFNFAPALIKGRGLFQYSCGIVPFRKPLYVVVGAPIHVQKVENPTSEQILALHSKYKVALTELYNTHKHTYARDPSIEITFV